MAINEETQNINRVSCKIPPLWKNNIQIWFVQVEANFATSQITNYLTKYNTVVSIDADSLVLVFDSILNPPPTHTQKIDMKH